MISDLIQFISKHIEIILYIIQIIIITVWIIVWYRNYKELLRKNQIEERPYIKLYYDNNYKIKNFWKTPVEIKKSKVLTNINYLNKKYNLNEKNEIIFQCEDIIKRINKKLPEIIMQWEEIDTKIGKIWGHNYDYKLELTIFFENHVDEIEKNIEITSFKQTF